MPLFKYKLETRKTTCVVVDAPDEAAAERYIENAGSDILIDVEDHPYPDYWRIDTELRAPWNSANATVHVVNAEGYWEEEIALKEYEARKLKEESK